MTSSGSAFAEKYGPWALVTGASSGIGAQFCRSLAKRGLNVILVARRVDRLEALASELSATYSVETHVLPSDLTKPDAVSKIESAVSDFDVGLLVNNAGMEMVGAYLTCSLENIEQLIALNVTAVAALARMIGKDLAKRNRGGIIFVSSMGARPGPFGALYSASKAFVTTLAVSLRYEVCEYGVEVMSFEPGGVRSEMVERTSAYMDNDKLSLELMDTEDAVESCLGAFGKGDIHTPGWKNRVVKFVIDYFPRWIIMPYMAKMMQGALPPEKATLAF